MPTEDDNTINKAREILSQRLYHSPALTHSDDTASFLALKLGQREQEVFAVILLNNQHQVIQYLEVFTGTINETSIYPREVVKLAHAVGVSVEGELGTIGQTGTSVEGGVSKVTYTDPAQAEDFIARTGADTLAVAIGTAHGIYPKGMQPELQMNILRDIAGRVDIPLVLHGGSANPDAEIAESVTLGVGKINISSDMKYAYFQKVREILAKETWWDPNVIYPEAISAARDVIRHKMKLFGSTGKASLY